MTIEQQLIGKYGRRGYGALLDAMLRRCVPEKAPKKDK